MLEALKEMALADSVVAEQILKALDLLDPILQQRQFDATVELIAAMGSPRFVTAEMVQPKATVIDVGINRLKDGSLVGDVDFETVAPKAAIITPVPGGIGPMTIASLLQNTLKSALSH